MLLIGNSDFCFRLVLASSLRVSVEKIKIRVKIIPNAPAITMAVRQFVRFQSKVIMMSGAPMPKAPPNECIYAFLSDLGRGGAGVPPGPFARAVLWPKRSFSTQISL